MIWPLFRGRGRNPYKNLVGFLVDLKTPKRHFKINWPLKSVIRWYNDKQGCVIFILDHCARLLNSPLRRWQLAWVKRTQNLRQVNKPKNEMQPKISSITFKFTIQLLIYSEQNHILPVCSSYVFKIIIWKKSVIVEILGLVFFDFHFPLTTEKFNWAKLASSYCLPQLRD